MTELCHFIDKIMQRFLLSNFLLLVFSSVAVGQLLDSGELLEDRIRNNLTAQCPQLNSSSRPIQRPGDVIHATMSFYAWQLVGMNEVDET